jgi:hypothetical protein
MEEVKLYWVGDSVTIVSAGIRLFGKIVDERNGTYALVRWKGIVSPCLHHLDTLEVVQNTN